MNAAEITETIRPILLQTYGDGTMVHSLAEHLGAQLYLWPTGYGDSAREDMIFRTCWDWMSGGSTAEAVAKRIEAAIS